MTYAEKSLIKTYTGLLNNLSSRGKTQLIKQLTKSVSSKTTLKEKEKAFFASFGAFESEQSAEEKIAEIKKGRVFRNKETIDALEEEYRELGLS